MTNSQFQLSAAEAEQPPVVTATGDIDLANVNEFSDVLNRAAADHGSDKPIRFQALDQRGSRLALTWGCRKRDHQSQALGQYLQVPGRRLGARAFDRSATTGAREPGDF